MGVRVPPPAFFSAQKISQVVQITSKELGKQHLALNIHVPKEAYVKDLNKAIAKYAKTATIKGFRPGTAPVALIKKTYGNSFIAEELDKIVRKNIQAYLEENKMNLIGQPLAIDPENVAVTHIEKDYYFDYELGVAPTIELVQPPKDEVFFYKIKNDPEIIEEEIRSMRKNFSTTVDTEFSGSNTIIDGTLTELDENGQPFEGGIDHTTSFLPDVLLKEEYKNLFHNLPIGGTFDFDLFNVFNRDEAAIKKQLLNIKEDIGRSINNNFRLTVHKNRTQKEAELDTEFFDKVLGPGKADSVEMFYSILEQEIAVLLTNMSERKLRSDIKHWMTYHCDLYIPVDYLRNVIAQNSKQTSLDEQQSSEMMAKYVSTLKWTLQRDEVAKKYNIKVTDDEIMGFAEGLMYDRLKQMGMGHAAEHFMEEMVQRYLAEQANVEEVYSLVLDERVLETLMDTWTFEEKVVTLKEFKDLSYHTHSHSHIEDHDH